MTSHVTRQLLPHDLAVTDYGCEVGCGRGGAGGGLVWRGGGQGVGVISSNMTVS